MKKFVLTALLMIAVWLLKKHFKPFESEPGAYLESEPSQGFTLAVPFRRNGFTIYPVASFQVDARVFGRKSYEDGEFESQLAPLDLALGWGPLADESVAGQITVTQRERFYFWQADHSPLQAEEISRNSANMHIIPASPEVKNFLGTIGPGQKISLKGKLVNVRGPDRWGWATSLTRTDTGEGACEVFYVENAAPIDYAASQGRTQIAQAATPVSRKPAPVAPEAPDVERSVRMTKTKTFTIPYGSVTVPAGDAVRIAAEKGSKVKAAYRGIEFWVERTELE